MFGPARYDPDHRQDKIDSYRPIEEKDPMPTSHNFRADQNCPRFHSTTKGSQLSITMRMSRILLIAATASIGAVSDAFKFMSNWQPPKILTDQQKLKIAKTQERFGDKSEFVVLKRWVDIKEAQGALFSDLRMFKQNWS